MDAHPDATVAVTVTFTVRAPGREQGGPVTLADVPPHPDGWDVATLAAFYGWSHGHVRDLVHEGEFGAPGVVGGPWKRGRTWIVPHAAKLARDARRSGVAPAAPVHVAPAPVLSASVHDINDRFRAAARGTEQRKGAA